MGCPIMNWDYQYCRFLFGYARILNQQLNSLRFEMHTLDPNRFPNQSISQEMIDPLEWPFTGLPTQALRQILAALAGQVAEPPQQDVAHPGEQDQVHQEDQSP